MRIRQVKPEFWRDWKLVSLSRDARLFYIGLWNEADDSGYLRWDLDQILSDLFPRQADVTIEMAEGWAQELVGARRIRIYKCGHATIPTLPSHQHLAGQTKQVHTFRNEHAVCQAKRKSPSPRVPAGPRAGQVRLVKVSNGNSKKEELTTRASASAREGSPQRLRDLLPPPPGYVERSEPPASPLRATRDEVE